MRDSSSYDDCPAGMFFSAGDLELCEVFEDPFVFEGFEDDFERLSGGCDDRLAGAAALFDAAIKTVQTIPNTELISAYTEQAWCAPACCPVW